MKPNIKPFIIVVAAIICTATAQAQLGGLKKLVEKKEPKQKTEAPADASSGNAEAAKPTAIQQKSSQSGTKAGELDFSAGTPQFSYLSLFREIELEEKTGRFVINGMSVINLPQKEQGGKDADYYNGHKLHLVVTKADKDGKAQKEIGRGTCSPSFRDNVALLSVSNGSMQLTEGGNYMLDLSIDGKSFHTVPFFVKKGTKDGQSKYFLSDPWGTWSYIKLTEKDNPYFAVEMGYYHALQTMDDKASADGKDVTAKLLQEETDKVVAAHLNTSGGRYSKRKWMPMMLTFYDAENMNSPFTGAKMLKKDGNYILRVRFGKNGSYDEAYVYKFAIKNGKMAERDGYQMVMDKDGYNGIDIAWLKGDAEGAVKTEGFITPSPVAGVKENIAFGIGNKGCRPPAACSITDGDIVSLSDMVLDNATRDMTSLKDIPCMLTLKEGDKIIAQHLWEQSCDESGCNQLYIDLVTNPDNLIFKNQSTAFVEALASLSAGAHKLTLVAEIEYSKGKKKVVGLRNFSFNSVAGNPKYTAIAAKLAKRLNMTENELNAEFWEKFGGPDVVTLVNNCSRTVWLRKSIGSDKAEVRIPPGGTFKYDTNDGYLEQWNFGTLRWMSTQNFFTNRQGDKVNICK